MKNKNYRVSRATLYNTIELLLDCNLVIKHQFGKNIAQFEKAYQCGQHDHLIDIETGKVIEFCDPRIHEIIRTASELYQLYSAVSFPVYLRKHYEKEDKNRKAETRMTRRSHSKLIACIRKQNQVRIPRSFMNPVNYLG